MICIYIYIYRNTDLKPTQDSAPDLDATSVNSSRADYVWIHT